MNKRVLKCSAGSAVQGSSVQLRISNGLAGKGSAVQEKAVKGSVVGYREIQCSVLVWSVVR